MGSCWESWTSPILLCDVSKAGFVSGSVILAALLMADIQLDRMPAVTAENSVVSRSSHVCNTKKKQKCHLYICDQFSFWKIILHIYIYLYPVCLSSGLLNFSNKLRQRLQCVPIAFNTITTSMELQKKKNGKKIDDNNIRWNPKIELLFI